MSYELKIIYREIIRFLLYSLTAAFTMMLLFLDVIWLKHDVGESSFVELSQEFMLLIISAIFLRLAYRYQSSRNLHILIAGLFLCMLIRELDSVLDHIHHGIWIYPALATTFICLGYTLQSPKDTLKQLAAFPANPHYGFMLSGLICVLVFSRLIGITALWKGQMGVFYMREVKNIVEEGVEFFGYALCFVATLYYQHQFSQEQQPEAKKTPPALSETTV